MTSRQMVKALKKWNISIVFDRATSLWWAGDAAVGSTYQLGSQLEVMLQVKQAGSQHVAPTPEQAVEDFCNARDLEWDV